MSRWPEPQAWCQAAWPSFPRWSEAVRAALFPLINAAHLRRGCRQAIAVTEPGQRARLHVVALAAERVQEPGRAVIAAGLLRAEDRFARWLTQFVSPSHT